MHVHALQLIVQGCNMQLLCVRFVTACPTQHFKWKVFSINLISQIATKKPLKIKCQKTGFGMLSCSITVQKTVVAILLTI